MVLKGYMTSSVSITPKLQKITKNYDESGNDTHNNWDIEKAKDRLAKMEEVMAMISTASKNRQDIRDILPPEYLSLLEEAEIEYPGGNRTRHQVSDVPVIEEESEDDTRTSRRYQRSCRRGSASRGEAGSSVGRNERYMREQESREISAMQKRLNKTTSRISAINEGSRHGHEKGAIKKQPQIKKLKGKKNHLACETKDAEKDIKYAANILRDHELLLKIADAKLIAKEACYHHSCSKKYLKTAPLQ
ncbi:uncharacterized protein LOC135217210 [Macrobrachium nipponense]|uniref:uncharacterized protein LOC135217210 n=1 Tax=Macrobrachium nipponense TaxID=159736 RepID=UPI0030C87BBC